MKVYIVKHVRPNLQVFDSYEKALTFAKAKANKQTPIATISFNPSNSKFGTLIYKPVPWTDKHIDIYEREVN